MSMAENVVNKIGFRAAERLVADFGGTRIYVPYHPSRSRVLTSSIGVAAAAELAKLFGGERFVVPRKNFSHRRSAIVALRRQGRSISAIARELKISERRVSQILSGPAPVRARPKRKPEPKSRRRRPNKQAAVRARAAAERARAAAAVAHKAAARAWVAAARARIAAKRAALAAAFAGPNVGADAAAASALSMRAMK